MFPCEPDRVSGNEILGLNATLETRRKQMDGRPPRRSAARTFPNAASAFIVALLLFTPAIYSHGQTSNLVGMYVAQPGYITATCPRPNPLPLPYQPPYVFGVPSYQGTPILDPNPTWNMGKLWNATDTNYYMGHMLDDMVAMGVDFIMVDMSNGIVYGQGNPGAPITCATTGSNFTASLLALMDLADSRLGQGTVTPQIAIFSPNPSSYLEGAGSHDPDWVWNNLVNNPSTGQHRPSYAWLNGSPLWGLWSYHQTIAGKFYPFLTSTTAQGTSRFTLRFICDSARGDCGQTVVSQGAGTVWPWSTAGNAPPTAGPVCPSSSQQSISCPVASTNSNEITIENGYQNVFNCLYYYPQVYSTNPCSPPNGVLIGFTPDYYNAQWVYAFQEKSLVSPTPQIVLISTYDDLEGGYIQPSSAYGTVPGYPYGDVYKVATIDSVTLWKGSLALGNTLSPPSP